MLFKTMTQMHSRPHQKVSMYATILILNNMGSFVQKSVSISRANQLKAVLSVGFYLKATAKMSQF